MVLNGASVQLVLNVLRVSTHISRRLKNIVARRLEVSLTELQLLVHVILNGMKLLTKAQIPSGGIRIIYAW